MLARGTLRKIRDYYFSTGDYSKEILRATKEFFGKSCSTEFGGIAMSDLEDALFNEWFTYDFKFADQKVALEKFYSENPLSIPEYRRKIYKDLMENYFGVYEILENKMFQGFALRHMGNDRVFNVSEFSATMGVVPGDIIINRVGKVEDHYELVGCDIPAFQASIEKDPVRKLEKLKKFLPKLQDLTPKDVRPIFMLLGEL